MNLKSLKRHFGWKGNIQSVIFSMIIALVLCIPVISDAGEVKVEKQTEVAVAATIEPRTYTLASRGGTVTEREIVIPDAITYSKSEGKGEIRDKIDNTLITNIAYIEADEEIQVPLTSRTFVIPADPEPEVKPLVKDITKPSGLSADQYEALIDKMLAKYKKNGSKLNGVGDAVYQAEQEYGVNGLFLLGIVSNESGWGTRLANTNNIAGITKKGGGFRSFSTVDECIMYMGKLLSNNYIGQGRTTVQAVGNKYCPSTANKPNQNIEWANQVSDIMNRYYTTAKSMWDL